MLTMMLIFQIDLGDLIPSSSLAFPARPGKLAVVVRRLPAPTSVKDLIEAVGVPHCEIGTVVSLVSRSERNLDSLTTPGDVLEVRGVVPHSLETARFLCDGHLGKLALLLRILGFDTAWDRSWSEPAMARRGINENRTVLTRSRSLLKRSELNNAMLIRSDDPDIQASEVVRRYLLRERVRLFGRCSRCNGLLGEIAKAEVAHRIPPRTAKWLDTYYLCRDCDQLFWEGTHVTSLRRRIGNILENCAHHDQTEAP